VHQHHNHCNDAQDSRKNQYAHSVVACRDIPNFGDLQFVHASFSHDTHTVIKGLWIQLFGKIQNILIGPKQGAYKGHADLKHTHFKLGHAQF
jgi:hypothetical protein